MDDTTGGRRPPAHGPGRSAANHGGRGAALCLRRSLTRSQGHSQPMLDRPPTIGTADAAGAFRSRHRTAPEPIEAAKHDAPAAGGPPRAFPRPEGRAAA